MSPQGTWSQHQFIIYLFTKGDTRRRYTSLGYFLFLKGKIKRHHHPQSGHKELIAFADASLGEIFLVFPEFLIFFTYRMGNFVEDCNVA